MQCKPKDWLSPITSACIVLVAFSIDKTPVHFFNILDTFDLQGSLVPILPMASHHEITRWTVVTITAFLLSVAKRIVSSL